MVVVSLTAPLLIGLYHNKLIFKHFSSKEKASDVLPKIFNDIEMNYNITGLYYAKGPGSFMAIKISYIFLKSYAIVKNIFLKAADGFYFNNNQPIKSIGKMYFIKKENSIILNSDIQNKPIDFSLPNTIKSKDFTNDCVPLYILPAV